MGQKKPNPWGLYDMHGNAQEWCRDFDGDKLPGGRDPVVTQGNANRVIRGGGWNAFAETSRSASRGRLHETNRIDFMGFRVVLSPVWLAALGQGARPQATPFAVYPVTTELQRFRLAESVDEAPRIRAYVTISGNDLIDADGGMRPGSLPAEEIAKALAPYVDRDNGIVKLNLHFGHDWDGKIRRPAEAADKSLRSALEKVGRSAGFNSAKVSSSMGGPLLEKKFGTVNDKVAGRADEDEPPSGDELVTVYPVRTILSLLLTDNADCVVVVRAPLDKDGENLLSPKVREAIVKYVAAAKPREKTNVLFSIKFRQGSIPYERVNKFNSFEMQELARSLGFESTSAQFLFVK